MAIGHLQSLVSGGGLSKAPRGARNYIKTDWILLVPSETVGKEIPATTKRVRFTAGLVYDENRELVRTHHPDQPEFVGTPTPEVDAAWDDLMGGSSGLIP